MAEYYFDEFQAYIKDLCIKNKDVLHNDETNRAFFRYNTDEEIQAIPQNAAKACVGIGDYTGRAVGLFDEHKLLQIPTIVFLVYAENLDGDPAGAIERAQQKAQQVMLQFYAKIKKDMKDNDCGPLRYLQAEQMTFTAMGPMVEKHYGWEMSIPFKADAPVYNPEKWND